MGVSSLAIPRDLDSVEDLSERDSGDYDLYVRAPTKNVAQHNNHAAMHSMMATQHAKKEHKTAVKAAKKAGTAPPPKLAKVKHPKLSATAKAEVKAHFNHASTLHKATTGLPGRKDKFTPQHGASKFLGSSSCVAALISIKIVATYSGKDARKASFQHHLATGADKPKDFKNRPFPAGHPTHAGQHPVPHLNTPAGNIKAKEHPIQSGGPGYLADKNKGPARVLVSPPGAAGANHHFQGVISHNPGTTGVGAGDHFLAHHSTR